MKSTSKFISILVTLLITNVSAHNFVNAEDLDNCKLKDAQVECEDLPTGVGARYERNSCFLSLSKQTCKLFKIESGSSLPLEQIKASKPGNFDEARRICQVEHELTHRADDRTAINRTCSEQKAYTMSYYCMNEFAQKYCATSNPLWTESECVNVCLNLLHNQLAGTSNECLCTRAKGSCEECFQACLSSISNFIEALPNFCDKEYLTNRIDSSTDCKAITDHYCSK